MYYNVPRFIKEFRRHALSFDPRKCECNNCEFTIDKGRANKSDVVIYDGIYMPEKLEFKRPQGQVWIFAAHEAPTMYHIGGSWWRENKYLFNWTMTYDKKNSDIHLPYGEIRKRTDNVKLDYEAIARAKPNVSLIITSHCTTYSSRMEFVKELSKYIDVNLLGKCSGKRWNCGVPHAHDEICFQELVNSHKYFLAFENAFCQQYITEKFFENFNYNTIMVTRGGLPGEIKEIAPKGSFISSDDFKSAKDLALYLKTLPVSEYARILERKDQYESIGLKAIYQRAFCDICHRMNFQDKYRKTIVDMDKWVNGGELCLQYPGVNDVKYIPLADHKKVP